MQGDAAACATVNADVYKLVSRLMTAQLDKESDNDAAQILRS